MLFRRRVVRWLFVNVIIQMIAVVDERKNGRVLDARYASDRAEHANQNWHENSTGFGGVDLFDERAGLDGLDDVDAVNAEGARVAQCLNEVVGELELDAEDLDSVGGHYRGQLCQACIENECERLRFWQL